MDETTGEEELEKAKHHLAKSNIKKFRLVLVVLFIGLIAGAFIEFQWHVLPTLFSCQQETVKVAEYNEDTKLPYKDPLSEIIAKAIAIASNSVVSITAQSQGEIFEDPFFGPLRTRPEAHLGTGIVYKVDGSTAYIVTNNHVVKNSTQIFISISDYSFKATIVGTDPATDIAVLKVDTGKLKLIPAKFADSDMLKPGYIVVAIGQPYGFKNTATMGIISALGRGEIFQSGGYADFIQTNAQINPGNSGGPLIDLGGKTVGINTVIYSETHGNVGIGFAIPSNLVRRVADDLITNGKVQRAALGVQVRPLRSEEVAQIGSGIMIAKVLKGSPAENAGLKPYDVITKVNGKKINSVMELRTKIAHFHPGAEITITVLRAGREKKLSVKLGKQN